LLFSRTYTPKDCLCISINVDSKVRLQATVFLIMLIRSLSKHNSHVHSPDQNQNPSNRQYPPLLMQQITKTLHAFSQALLQDNSVPSTHTRTATTRKPSFWRRRATNTRRTRKPNIATSEQTRDLFVSGHYEVLNVNDCSREEHAQSELTAGPCKPLLISRLGKRAKQ
jgi:hypothetical protein